MKLAGLVFSVIILWGCASTPNTAPNNVIHLSANSQGQTGTTGFQSHQTDLIREGAYLNIVILESSGYIGARIPAKSKIAVLPMQSASVTLGSYISDSISMHLVNQERFMVIERSDLDNIRNEQNYQLSGEVSDDTAVSIGRQLGTQMIITGSIMPLGDNYSLRIKITNVETAQITGSQIYIVRPDTILLSLLNSPAENQDRIAEAASEPEKEPEQQPKQQVNIDNVIITNNNTTTINGDVYINRPSWFDPKSLFE